MTELSLKFYRHATMLLSYGQVRLLIDPMYQRQGRLPPIPSVRPFKWNPLLPFPGDYPVLSSRDILLITHHHFDHFDRTAAGTLPKDVSVVTPSNGAARLAGMGFNNLLPLSAGETAAVNGVRITAVPTKHAERMPGALYKPGVGYLIGLNSKINVYISGDTVLFVDLIDVLATTSIEVAILYGGGARIPLFGRHTLSHHEVLSFVRQLHPSRTVVVHLDCLNHCPETRDQLLRIIEVSGLDSPILLPLPGQELLF